MQSIDRETADKVKNELRELLKELGPPNNLRMKYERLPPKPLRWFIVAYVLALAVAMPSAADSWVHASGFFLVCIMGLFAIEKDRRLRANTNKKSVDYIRLVPKSSIVEK